MRRLPHLCAFVLLSICTIAHAEEPPPEPALPSFQGATSEAEEGKEKVKTAEAAPDIDIANIVTSAAKGVTTVQEAPSIITIVTSDDIKARGFRTLTQALDTIPGWFSIDAEGNQVTLPIVRGTAQAALLLHDGVSMFDPLLNIQTFSRAQPLETLKRIEVVTGPGGVLWGANSFLGIVNLISKDAEDVNGVEVNAGYGDGPGNVEDFRAYALFGKVFFNGKLKVFLHASYEDYQGEQFTLQQFYATSPAPQPVGPAVFGCTTSTDPGCVYPTTNQERSWIANFDGKIGFLGNFTLYFGVPVASIQRPMDFSGGLIVPEKDVPSFGAQNQWNLFDRYATLEYKDRFFREKLGVNAKLYYVDFVRDIAPRVFVSSTALPGGLTFDVSNLLVQRYGGTLDTDFSGPWSWNRLLVGGEAFEESTSQSQSTFKSPVDPATGMSDPGRLPIVCPVEPGPTGTLVPVPNCPLVFAYAADRTVVGAFVDDQIRPVQGLTFDGGVRYQQGFGSRPYAGQILGSASAVAQLFSGVHLKLNWSQGFRPPVFNNTDSNGKGVEFGGNPNLQVERSQAYQAELNARLLKNVKRIRELQIRLDYSYTVLDNLIVLEASQYANSGRRAIQSAELLSKLYLEGDHQLTLGYTYLQAATSDKGELRSVPNHWFTVGMVFNLVKDTLDVNGTLNVFGAYEDPNRYVSASNNAAIVGGTVANFSDLVLDRLTPVAWLQVGARLRLWKDHLTASVQVYNALNQRFYFPDPFYDLSPTVEIRPSPAPGFNAFGSLTFRP